MPTDPDLARAAHRLVSDDAFEAAISELRTTAHAEWANSPSDAADRREIAYHKNTAVMEVYAMIKRWAADHVA